MQKVVRSIRKMVLLLGKRLEFVPKGKITLILL